MSLEIAPYIVARFDSQRSSAAALCPNRCAQLFHLHGVGDGERVAHCITNYPDSNRPEYQLQHATEATARVGDWSVAEAIQLLWMMATTSRGLPRRRWPKLARAEAEQLRDDILKAVNGQ